MRKGESEVGNRESSSVSSSTRLSTLDSKLSNDQRRRYARHLLVPEIGEAGQAKLAASSILVIGAGGLGAAALSYLAAAGIGRIGIVDHDHVELSNLNRQIIHESGDINRKKVESAADRISEINPECEVEMFAMRFEEFVECRVESRESSDSLTRNSSPTLDSRLSTPHYQIVLDGCDNFPTRFAINAACHAARIPLISGAVRGLEGQITTFKSYLGKDYPCYRCLVPDLPPDRNDCAEGGILGPVVGVIGSLMAVEAVKELLGIGESLSGRLQRYDARTAEWKTGTLRKDPACPVCSN